MANRRVPVPNVLGAALLCTGVLLAHASAAHAGDPDPTETAKRAITAFNNDGVIVRALALKTDTLKYESCNLNVPFTKETYSLFKATKSTTWLGPELPQIPYEFNENNRVIDLFQATTAPKWNPFLLILERDKTVAHAVQFLETDGNTNVNNFVDHDWIGAESGCWSDPAPDQVLRCNLIKLGDLITLMVKSYRATIGLKRALNAYNEVRLFNYEPSAILGLAIEDRQCKKTTQFDCVLDPEQVARLKKLVNAFWYGPKRGTKNPCPSPQVLAYGFGSRVSLPREKYPATYNTFDVSKLSEIPVFRLVYMNSSNPSDSRPTRMELRYVTSIIPDPPETGPMDLESLPNGQDL